MLVIVFVIIKIFRSDWTELKLKNCLTFNILSIGVSNLAPDMNELIMTLVGFSSQLYPENS